MMFAGGEREGGEDVGRGATWKAVCFGSFAIFTNIYALEYGHTSIF